MNQQNTLPYNPVAITTPFISININQPTCVPNIQCDSRVQQYLPFISGLVACEIQNKAEMNHLRRFMFNQCAINNFNNNDFANVVSATVDYVTLTFLSNGAPSVEAAVNKCVPEMVAMCCAYNLQVFQALQGYAPQEAVQDLNASIATFNRIAGDVANMKRQMGIGQQAMPQYQQPVFVQPQQQGFPQQGNFPQQQAIPAFNRGQQQGATFNTGNRPGMSLGAPNNGRVTNEKYSNQQNAQQVLQQPFTPRAEFQPVTQQQPQTQVLSQPVIITEPILVDPLQESVNWKVGGLIPYVPAYNPFTHKLYFQIDVLGNTTPILKEQSMDYEKHATATVFGKPPKNMDVKRIAVTLNRIADGITEMSKEPKTEIKEGEKVVKYVKEEWIAEMSESMLWFLSSLDRLRAAADNNTSSIYRVYGMVAEPVVDANDLSNIIKNFSNSNTFIELREKLKASKDTIAPVLWTVCDFKITQAVNRVIRQNLSIPDMYIDSFTTDIESLITMFENDYGPAIKDAFVKHEANIIQSVFVLCDEAMTINLADGFIENYDFPEGKKPVITFVASNYSLTYLDCLSSELGLELFGKLPSSVTLEYTPVLYNLVKELFDDADKIGVFERHLIHTNDNRIMEATKGYIGSDIANEFYLLTLIK